MKRTTLFSIAALTVTAVTSGCASTHEASTQAQQLSNLFAGYSADYNPASDTEELAGYSTLVVSGRLLEVTDGRERGQEDDEIDEVSFVTLAIEVDDVSKGAPEGRADIVYVELSSPLHDASEYADALPPGSTIVAYLFEAPDTGEEGMLQGASDLPPEQRLYSPTSPQGLLVSQQDGTGFIGVQTPVELDDATVSDLLPGGGTVLLGD